jgi:hypothetical protein
MSSQLSPEIIEYIAQVKELEQQFLALISSAPEGVDGRKPDGRWQAVSKTHIQEGRMALVRSVTEQ